VAEAARDKTQRLAEGITDYVALDQEAGASTALYLSELTAGWVGCLLMHAHGRDIHYYSLIITPPY